MAKKPKPYTRILGKFLHKLGYRDLSKHDVAVTKSLLLDYIGYAACSVEEKPARILRRLAAEMGGPPEATIIGTAQRVGAVWASLVNGSMGHMTELDDTHRGTQSHMGDSVLPAALAVGEKTGAQRQGRPGRHRRRVRLRPARRLFRHAQPLLQGLAPDRHSKRLRRRDDGGQDPRSR